MLEFDIPEGFDNDEVAVHVPEEYLNEFLEYLDSLNYEVNINYLRQWAQERISESHHVFFHYEGCKSIQAFTEESWMYDEYPITELIILPQTNDSYEDVLSLL